MKFTMRLPYLPPTELSPNWNPYGQRAMWVRVEAGRKLQIDVFYLCKEEIGLAGIKVPFDRITVRYTFICPNHRRRDGDNYIARMKACQDALIYAGLVGDDTHDRVQVLPPVFRVEKGRSETIIEVEGS